MKGFTLVELSIVLVIIGLLIGGILVAQSMISTAKSQRVINEVSQYQTMYRLFEDRFKSIPGDFPRANPIFNGCALISGSCNGDGNGFIGGTDGATIDTLTDAEGTLAWNHMSLAGLTPVPYSGAWVGVRPVYSTALPKSTYEKGAMYNFYSVPRLGAIDGVSAFWWYGFTRKNALLIATLNVSNNLLQGIIKPQDALAIDGKIDDGKPRSGSVWGESTATSTATDRHCLTVHGTNMNTNYNPNYNSTEHSCQMLFTLDERIY